LYKTPKRLVNRMAALAISKKAESVMSIDLRGLSSACDFFVICEGTSNVHVRAIGDAIEDGLRESGEKAWHVEGRETGHWVLLDYVNVVVHVFDKETRDYYQLDRLWGDAKIEKYEDE
jgi:ribosome-associated protein